LGDNHAMAPAAVLQNLDQSEQTLRDLTSSVAIKSTILGDRRLPMAADDRPRRCDRLDRRIQRQRRYLLTWRPAQLPFNRLPEILNEVEAISDLPGLGCALCGTVSMEPATISAYDRNFRVASKPPCSRLRRAVGQHMRRSGRRSSGDRILTRNGIFRFQGRFRLAGCSCWIGVAPASRPHEDKEPSCSNNARSAVRDYKCPLSVSAVWG